VSNSDVITAPGKTCWKSVRAERIGFIIDGEAYFGAARECLLRAERTAYLLAWDFHSEVLLRRPEPDDGYPAAIGPFLEALLESKPDLDIYILLWDYSLVYLAEREWRIASKWLRRPHPRLHFRYDDQLPKSASHHQKILVVDDTLAFCGGLDFSVWRWDTTEHRPSDPRRRDPSGKSYAPYHDLGIAVDGPAARALAELFRERWRNATGTDLPALEEAKRPGHWPDGLEPSLRDTDVGIARSSAVDPESPVREVEALHLAAIRSARRFLFFENQYFSSTRIAEALIERLREDDGPEIVMILTPDTGGWMEEGTMGLMRDRLLERIGQADADGRFRAYSPQVSDEDGGKVQVYVHAKLFIADDRIIKIGSSNLSNRSMRVDTECDLFVECAEPDTSLTAFRQRIIAMHLGIETSEYGDSEKAEGSLITGIEAAPRRGGHSLERVKGGCGSEAQRQLADSRLLDPDEPIDPGFWIRKRLPKDSGPSIVKRALGLGALIAAAILVGLAFEYGWGPLPQGTGALELIDSVRHSPWAPLAAVAFFLFGATLGVPLNLIVVGATLLLGPWLALGCGLAGSLAGAAAGFALGRYFGKPVLQHLSPEKIELLDRKLAERGILPVAFVRLFPVAPFAVINIVAGSSRLPFRPYALGTLLGMLPGMSAVVFITHEAGAAVRQPDPATVALLAVATAVVAAAFVFLYRTLGKRPRKKNS
jgi:phosphatidylserine/phosphatidylglycerophosphate/cardiolipin synthase-like enzyme/membrane protein DedA with SNARE-associated domain